MISSLHKDLFGKEKAMIDERSGRLARVLVDYSIVLEFDFAGVNDAG